MASSRSARFARLLTLRERELDDKKRLLGKSENGLRAAMDRVREGQEALRRAATGFRVDPGEARMAQDFEAKSDWLKTTVQALERLLDQKRLAEESVRAAKAAQMNAERERRKVELLLEKIREEEKLLEVRADQKETDEIAQGQLGREREARRANEPA